MQRFKPEVGNVETNPTYNQLEDLQQRTEALRGYL